MFKNKKLIAVNALVLAALLFGSTFIIVKNLLDDLSPTTVVFLRYLIASILFLISGGFPTKEYLSRNTNLSRMKGLSYQLVDNYLTNRE